MVECLRRGMVMVCSPLHQMLCAIGSGDQESLDLLRQIYFLGVFLKYSQAFLSGYILLSGLLV